jgi:hypothetical protein
MRTLKHCLINLISEMIDQKTYLLFGGRCGLKSLQIRRMW